MDIVKGRWKKTLVFRRRSLGAVGKKPSTPSKSRALLQGTAKSSGEENKHKVAPEGCFTVCVGAQKQRFFVKTEFANHPLFKMLLEDAESEYGYSSEGPIMLPCEVDLFYDVLAAMESGDEISNCCTLAMGLRTFGRGCGSYSPLCPSPMIRMK